MNFNAKKANNIKICIKHILLLLYNCDFQILNVMLYNLTSPKSPLKRDDSVTTLHSALPSSVLGRLGISNIEFLTETRWNGGAETQLLNPKSLLTSYDVKAYVLLTAIGPWDEDVKPDGPVVLFRKE